MPGIKTLLVGFLITVCLFFPAFNTFFTNDDFFLLNISRAENPLQPAAVLKTALSDNNYFADYYPRVAAALYLTSKPDKIEPGRLLIPARQFLGY